MTKTTCTLALLVAFLATPATAAILAVLLAVLVLALLQADDRTYRRVAGLLGLLLGRPPGRYR